MTIEAMKQALEALKECNSYLGSPDLDEPIATLRQAIEQAEKQEPVAWVTDLEFDSETELIPARRKGKLGTDGMDIPLYAQPRREWVGLTDEEVQFVYADSGYNDIEMFAAAIEAKLKEKNT